SRRQKTSGGRSQPAASTSRRRSSPLAARGSRPQSFGSRSTRSAVRPMRFTTVHGRNGDRAPICRSNRKLEPTPEDGPPSENFRLPPGRKLNFCSKNPSHCGDQCLSAQRTETARYFSLRREDHKSPAHQRRRDRIAAPALSPTVRGQAHVASAKYFVMASESDIERLAVAVRDTIHASSGLAGLLRDGHYQ